MSKQQEALRLALEALEYISSHYMSLPKNADPGQGCTYDKEALAEQPAQPEQCQCPACKIAPHESDCPVHNEPAWPNGPCDCGAQQQEPVAFDKTEINCFAQDLYDQKMREGKHGHYESMFHVIHQCIKKVSPPASKPWVSLTEVEVWNTYKYLWMFHSAEEPRLAGDILKFARAIEAKLKEKNNG